MECLLIGLGVIVAVIVLGAVAAYLYICHQGHEDLIALADSHSAFVLDEQTEDSLTFSTNVNYVNKGKQCATIMDCLVRPHLPFEQYDGLDLRGRAELVGAPREDDYFEAYIVQRADYPDGSDKATIKAQVKLTARKGMNIKEAISKMPDFNFQIIWLEAGRRLCCYRQVRIEVPAKDIAALAGTELVDE